MVHKIKIQDFHNSFGTVQDIAVTYQFFGREFGTAPLVLVNHSLSGNSQVTGENGWWNAIVGEGKTIDTSNFSVLAIDMPGNGFSGNKEDLLLNYKEFTLGDIAKVYTQVFESLNIKQIYAGIGGSIGGALLWEIASQNPNLFKHIIPIAADYKATAWLKALCLVQDQILNNSNSPVNDARMHAMTFYRSPASLKVKFANSNHTNLSRSVESWLIYHGKALENRFELATYKLLNHLLTTTHIGTGNLTHIDCALNIKSSIHIITVNSDGFFLPDENWETYVNLSLSKDNVHIHEIKSVHGHDAFLIENNQLISFLAPIFNVQTVKNEENTHNIIRNR